MTGIVEHVIPREVLDPIFTPAWVDAGIPDALFWMFLIGIVYLWRQPNFWDDSSNGVDWYDGGWGDGGDGGD